MVGIFVLLIKLSRMHMTAQKMTNLLLPGFLSSKYACCRTCRSKDMHVYCNYTRKITEYQNGHIVDSWLETKRFKCGTCHHTHAFLVSIIIPYYRYSLLAVLWALSDYYSHRLTVGKICKKYKISAPTLYHWKKQFQKHKELWLGVLRNTEMSEIEFLKYLMNIPDYRTFDLKFREMMPDHRAFMQGHKNARSQRYA